MSSKSARSPSATDDAAASSSHTHAKVRQIAIGIVASLNGFIWGLVVGYSSPAVDSFMRDGFAPFEMTENVRSLMGSIPNVGALIGNAISGPLTARFGRRRVFQLAMAPQVLAWVLLGFSKNPAMMLTARVIQGAGADLWGPIAQLYAVEIAQPELRDSIGGLAMFELTIGMFVSYAVGGFLRWDHMAFAVAGFLALVWPLTFLLPESPVYLLSKNRVEEARAALTFLRGPKHNTDDELDSLQLHKETDGEKSSMKDLLKGVYVKPLLLVILLIFLRQWTGPYAIYTFVVEIFRLSGSSADPHTSSMILGAMQIGFQVIAVTAVKRFGKKVLAVVSACMLCAGQFGMGLYFYLVESGANITGGLNYLPLISTCAALMGFNLGLSSFPFVLMGELLPDKIRNHAAGLCFFINCAMAFLVVESFYHLSRLLHLPGTFWLYSVFAFAVAIVIIFCTPNTQGKSLAELQNQFDDGSKKNNLVYPADSKPIVIIMTNDIKPDKTDKNYDKPLNLAVAPVSD